MSRPRIGTAYYAGKQMYVLSISNNDVMLSPMDSERGEVVFVALSAISQYLPDNSQTTPSKLPENSQSAPRQLPDNSQPEGGQLPDSSHANSEKIAKARAALPTTPSLFEQVADRWIDIELLERANYAGSPARNAAHLVQLVASGELATIPRPVYASIEHLLPDGRDRRQSIARTARLVAEYQEAFYPSPFWLKVDAMLNQVDYYLTRTAAVFTKAVPKPL